MRRLLIGIGTLALLALGDASPAHACTVCFGEAQGPLIEGAKTGVWILFSLTACVQVAFVYFFYSLHRKAKAAPDRVLVKGRMRLIKGEK